MDIILLERVAKLGQIGDVVSVKNGFARNFLLPQKKALRATKANLAVFEVQRKDIEANNLVAKSEAEALVDKIQPTVNVPPLNSDSSNEIDDKTRAIIEAAIKMHTQR